MCGNLLRMLPSNIRVNVINDGSDENFDENYGNVIAELGRFDDYSYWDMEHCGRERFWLLWNHAMKATSGYHHIFIPDDVMVRPSFVKSAIELYESLVDHNERTGTLNLLADQLRKGKSQWTHNQVRPVSVDGIDYFDTGWVDGCFICSTDVIEALERKINPISEDRFQSETVSSGVGEQISKRLHALAWKMYQVQNTLVHHGHHESMMHPVERQNNPLVT